MRVLLTGLTRKDLEHLQNTREMGRACYLCKRREGEESVVLEAEEADAAPKLAFRSVEIDTLTWVMATEDDEEVEVAVPVCAECQVVLGMDAFDEAEEDGNGEFLDLE